MPVTLPQLPPWPTTGLIIFSPAAWKTLGQSQQALYAADQVLLTVLGGLTQAMETMMSSIADLTASVATEDAKVEALIAAYTAAKNNPNTTLDAADQAALDAAVAALGAEGAAIDTANPPTPSAP